MTPKQKAKELLDNFIPHTRVYHEVLGWEDYIDSAKKCALIAVNEILNLLPLANRDYWQEVKQEIEKL
jgi:hypothetical protein